MLLLAVTLLVASVVAEDGDERLNMFVRRYEPLYYDPEPVHRSHRRAKRSTEDGGNSPVHFQLRSTKRSINLRLSADASVFHKDLVVESSREGVVKVDTSHIYKGYIVGNPRSRVFGSLHGGIFEGSIDTGSGHSLYVERAEKFFNDTRAFHSVLYSSADLDFPTGGRWCGLHGRTEEWMMDILRRYRLKSPSSNRRIRRGWAGRRLQAVTSRSAVGSSDEITHVTRVADGKEVEDSARAQQGEQYNEEAQNIDGEDDDRTTEAEEDIQLDEADDDSDVPKKQTRRRAASISRRVCNLEIIVDNTLFDSVLQHVPSVPKARELITSIIAQTVDKVNSIYGSTDFDGIEDVNFVVQHIVMGEPGDCVGYKAKHDPLCSTSLDAPYTLYLASLSRHDDYCLSFRFNYRDFADGTLGLAWIASVEAGSGGICERYRMAVELHPGTGLYKQAKMSLNTGITTLINHRQYVGLPVAALTLAHEIGHSFGAPHDSGSLCDPSGPEGKYLMYESATKGDKPNNDRFSSCSIGNISRILAAFFKGELPREMCFQRHSGPVCGNQIVEGDEECDCGTNEAECTDKCCYPRHTSDNKPGCRLKGSAKCSPTAGACCTTDCEFVPRGKLCSEKTDCTERSYCECLTSKRAKCPKAAAKPNMTACNKNTQVCLSGQCLGSICKKYGLMECFRKAGGLSIEEQCLLTCQAPGSPECKVACDFPEMASHCGARLQPGSPCNAMRGYCDVFHKCRLVEPRGFLTRLQGFFFGGESMDTLYEFVAHHPIAACLVVLGSSWFMVLVFRCFALHTPSHNPLKKPPFKLKDTLRHPINTLVSN